MIGNLNTLPTIPYLRTFRAKIIIACCLIGGLIGGLYAFLATPLYTASAAIIVENRQVRVLRDVSSLPDAPVLDPNEASNQAEVLSSDQVGLAVVRKLDLTKDPAFVDPAADSNVEAEPSSASNALADANKLELIALRTLKRNVRITQLPRTSVVKVEYISSDPVRAAQIANAFTDAYMFEQLNWRREATRSARGWLQQRSLQLLRKYEEADLEAQKYKTQKNLFTTKGAPLIEQQYSEMTTQLVNERAAVTQAQARYQRLKKIVESHETNSALTEALDNSMINDLRMKYLAAYRQKIDLERKLGLGQDHKAVKALRSNMEVLNGLIFDELSRLTDTYKNDYEVALAREKALVESLSRLQGVAMSADDAQAQLRQQEHKVETYKALYQTYMQRYQEASQDESAPVTDTHVIGVATPPLTPSHPRKALILAISLVAGGLLGYAGSVLREMIDDVFRTASQLKKELGFDVIGMIPDVSRGSAQDGAMGVSRRLPLLRYAVDHPFSSFAETLRSAKATADIALEGRAPKIIGVVSLLANEGKSTISKNFASLLAAQGARTLLIDADTRRATSLTESLESQFARGVPGIFQSRTITLRIEPETGLLILPSSVFMQNAHTVASGLSAAMVQEVVKMLDRPFDYVVIDLPPIGPVSNARGIASAIDGFIFVVAWGETSRGAIRNVLEKEQLVRSKILGVVLNKADMEKLSQYENFDPEGYYSNRSSPHADGRRRIFGAIASLLRLRARPGLPGQRRLPVGLDAGCLASPSKLSARSHATDDPCALASSRLRLDRQKKPRRPINSS